MTFTLATPTYTYLLAAYELGTTFSFDGVSGPLLVDVASVGVADFGFLPAGSWVVSIPMWYLPPTVSGAAVATRPLYTDSAWSFVEIGNPSHLLAIDSSY